MEKQIFTEAKAGIVLGSLEVHMAEAMLTRLEINKTSLQVGKCKYP